jgi:group I intron endonuclease
VEFGMIIYKAVNKINGKVYIGQTIKLLEKRLYEHSHYKLGYFGSAIKKYGWNSFDCEIIEYCLTDNELNERETYWIKYFNSLVPNGYNLTLGGEGLKGASEQTRRKLSEAKSGPNHPFYGIKRPLHSEFMKSDKNPNTRDDVREKKRQAMLGSNHPFRGKKQSKESNVKRSTTLKEKYKKERHPTYGRIMSDEQRKSNSEKMKGENNPMYGKFHTSKAKEKISVKNKGIKRSEEFKKNISKINKGRLQSKETKLKRSESIKLWWRKKKEQTP